jgi:hypothetical protein
VAWPDDPSPNDELASDIAFGVWLDGLDPGDVIRDFESGIEGAEGRTLAYLRKRMLRSSHPQSDPMNDRQKPDDATPVAENREARQ